MKVGKTYNLDGPEAALDQVTVQSKSHTLSMFTHTLKSALLPGLEALLIIIGSICRPISPTGSVFLLQAVDDELKRLRLLSEEESTLTFDPRLQNIVVYLYQNHAPLHVGQLLLILLDSLRNVSGRIIEGVTC